MNSSWMNLLYGFQARLKRGLIDLRKLVAGSERKVRMVSLRSEEQLEFRW